MGVEPISITLPDRVFLIRTSTISSSLFQRMPLSPGCPRGYLTSSRKHDCGGPKRTVDGDVDVEVAFPRLRDVPPSPPACRRSPTGRDGRGTGPRRPSRPGRGCVSIVRRWQIGHRRLRKAGNGHRDQRRSNQVSNHGCRILQDCQWKVSISCMLPGRIGLRHGGRFAAGDRGQFGEYTHVDRREIVTTDPPQVRKLTTPG